MTLEEILTHLSKKLNTSLKLDANGVCRFFIQEKQALSLEKAQENSFYLYAICGQVPLQNNEQVFPELLEANLFQKETGVSYLAYDSKTLSVILFCSFQENTLDFENFEKKLGNFLAYLSYWQEKTQEKSKATQLHKVDPSILKLIGKKKLNIFFP